MKIILSSDAISDIRSSSDWYKNKKSGLEKDFIESIRNQFKLIELFPLSY